SVQPQADRAVSAPPSAQGVGVGDDVIVGGGDQHPLDLLPGAVGGRQGEAGQRVDGGRFAQHGQAGCVHGDLGEAVVLAHLAGDLHVVADGDLVHGGRGVDEYRRGCLQVGRVHLPSGSGGLDVVAVEPALGVDSGDHTGGGHLVPCVGAGRSGSLNLRDGECLRRRVLVVVITVARTFVAPASTVIAVVATVARGGVHRPEGGLGRSLPRALDLL